MINYETRIEQLEKQVAKLTKYVKFLENTYNKSSIEYYYLREEYKRKFNEPLEAL